MASDKQKVFISEYLIDLNGTAAAKRAGYAERSARQTAFDLLHTEWIRKEIDLRLKERAMSADEVLTRLTIHASASLAECISVEEATDKAGKVIYGPDGKPRLVAYIDLPKAMQNGAIHLVKKITEEKGKYSVELEDRLVSLQTLAKYHRLLVDRVAITDWREEARSAGISDTDAVFEQFVEHFFQTLTAGDKPATG